MRILPTPCPTKDYRRDKDSVHDIDQWAGLYFDHITSCYKRREQRVMHAMFYSNQNVVTQDDLLTTTQSTMAETSFDWDISRCTVTIDKHIAAVSLLNQEARIHEIAVHVPYQLLIFDHDYDAPCNINSNSFQELSAAACEYYFLKPINHDVVAQNIDLIVNPPIGDKHLNLKKASDERISVAQNNSLADYLEYRSDFYHFEDQDIARFQDNLALCMKQKDNIFYSSVLRLWNYVP